MYPLLLGFVLVRFGMMVVRNRVIKLLSLDCCGWMAIGVSDTGNAFRLFDFRLMSDLRNFARLRIFELRFLAPTCRAEARYAKKWNISGKKSKTMRFVQRLSVVSTWRISKTSRRSTVAVSVVLVNDAIIGDTPE